MAGLFDSKGNISTKKQKSGGLFNDSGTLKSEVKTTPKPTTTPKQIQTKAETKTQPSTSAQKQEPKQEYKRVILKPSAFRQGVGDNRTDAQRLAENIKNVSTPGLGGAIPAFAQGLVDTLTLGAAERIDPSAKITKKIAEEKHPIATTVGKVAGYVAPGSLATKATKAVGSGLVKLGAKEVSKKLVKSSLIGAGSGAILGGAEGAIRGKTPQEIARDIGVMGATGAVLNPAIDVAIGAIGKGFRALFPKKEVPTTALQRGKGTYTMQKPAEKPVPSTLDVKNNINPTRVSRRLNPTDTRIFLDNMSKAGLSKQEIQNEIKSKMSDMENEMLDFLKVNKNGTKNYDRGAIKHPNGSYTRYSVTDNPEWYSEFYKTFKKKPTIKDLKSMSVKFLERGFQHYGDVPANESYLALKNELETIQKTGNKSFKASEIPTVKIFSPKSQGLKQIEIPTPVEIPTPKAIKPTKATKTTPTEPVTPIQPQTQPITPVATQGKQKVSKFFTNSLQQGNALTQEGKNALDEAKYVYDVKANEGSLARAESQINTNGIQNEVERLKANGLNSAEDSMAHFLITSDYTKQALNATDENTKKAIYSQMNDFIEKTRPSITNAGQTIQALSQFKKTTPEGALMTAHSVVENVQKAIKADNPAKYKQAENMIARMSAEGVPKQTAVEKAFAKYKIPTITAEDAQKITETMARAQNLTGRAKDIEIAKAMKIIGDKIPATLGQKVQALQRISLLLNPKTMTRNVVGNVILGGLENVKDVAGTPIDIATSLFTKQRSTTLPSLSTQLKGFARGGKETGQDIALGIDTSATRGQYDLPINQLNIPQTKIFDNKILNALDKATKAGLQFGDRPFYQGAFDDRLKQLMNFAKTDKPTEDMIAQATEFAKDRTFQNESNIAKGMQGLQRGLNKLTGSEKVGIGTFAVPFPKTPGNILDKAIDYSPIGAMRAVNELKNATKGTFNQKVFVDKLARSATGTGLIALGYDLAKKGVLKGKPNQDKDVAALEKQMGNNPYSIKVGNDYITIDWAQPSAVPLMIGADLFQEGKTKKEVDSTILDALKSGGETLFKQSLLQGVQKLFGGYTPLSGVEDVIKSVPSQFTPSALKMVTQFLDDTQRETYSPSTTGQALKQVQAKLPGMSKELYPKLDTLGREVKIYQGKNNAGNIMFNPAFVTKEKSTPGENMILDIYNASGGMKEHFPRIAEKKIKGMDLTEKQYYDLQKLNGTLTNRLLQKLANNKDFNKPNMSKEEAESRAKLIQAVLTEVYTIAKMKTLPKKYWETDKMKKMSEQK